MKKKLVAMTLVLAMAGTTLAGCGGSKSSDSKRADRLFQQKMQTKTLITLMEKTKLSIQTKQ